MPRIRLLATALSALLASALLIGCASTGTDEADKPTLAEFDANLNQGVVLARILGLDGKKKAEAARTISDKDGVLAKKLGLVVSATTDPKLAQELAQALRSAQADYSFTLIPAPELAQQLSAYGCEPSQPEDCTERLAIYPGVQQLLQITRLEATQDKVLATAQLYNAAHGFKHAPLTLEQPVAASRATPQACRSLADKILSAASTAAGEAPWSTRAFKQDGSEIFLAAGQRSGLKPGMVLAVHGPGRTITSPTGGVVGWIPGAKQGAVKVTTLFGADYAIAELLEGEPPAPTDSLLLAE